MSEQAPAVPGVEEIEATEPADRPVRTLSPATLDRLGVTDPVTLRGGLDAWRSIEPATRRGMVDYLTTSDRSGDEWRAAFPTALGTLDNAALRFVLEQLMDEPGAGGAVL